MLCHARVIGQKMPRRFVTVARPRLLLETLSRSFGLRYYSASTNGQTSFATANSERRAIPHLNIVEEFKGREQDDFPCVSRSVISFSITDCTELINLAIPFNRIKRKNGPLVKMRGSYGEMVEGYQVFTHDHKFHFKHGT